MAKFNPATMAQNWQQGVSGAGAKYTAGIKSVTVAPGQLAAAQADTWAQNTVAAKQKFAQNVGSVSLSYWQSQASQFGSQKYASSASKGLSKFQSFVQQVAPVMASFQSSLPSRGSKEQNQQRYQAAQQIWSQFSYQKRSL